MKNQYTEQDRENKSFEVAKNFSVNNQKYFSIRLDGVKFSSVTKKLKLHKPYDHNFINAMVDTCKHLMENTPGITMAYTQSDEITLIFDQSATTYSRRIEKLATVLAGRASGFMSLKIGALAAFDARVIVFPDLSYQIDNILWRIEDAVKNCRNGYVFWDMVNRGGFTQYNASSRLSNQDKEFLEDYIFRCLGIDFKEINPQEKRGTLLYRAEVAKKGYNPGLDKETETVRSIIYIDKNLPYNLKEWGLAEYIIDRQNEILSDSKILL